MITFFVSFSTKPEPTRRTKFDDLVMGEIFAASKADVEAICQELFPGVYTSIYRNDEMLDTPRRTFKIIPNSNI